MNLSEEEQIEILKARVTLLENAIRAFLSRADEESIGSWSKELFRNVMQ